MSLCDADEMDGKSIFKKYLLKYLVDSNIILIFEYVKPIKYKDMNQINEEINIKEASCREMYIPDLMALLRSSGCVMMSWGSHNFTIDKKNDTRMFRMNVQGHHHKGHVYIFLNGLDLFDVYLTSNRGTIKDRTDEQGLYFDQLVEWIDEKVERIPEYTR